MLPQYHLISGILFGLLFDYFKLLTIPYIIIFVFVTFFLDIDHYIIYIYESRNLSLKKLYNEIFFERKYVRKTWIHKKYGIITFLIIGRIIFFFNKELAVSILLGYFLHLLLDLIYYVRYKKY